MRSNSRINVFSLHKIIVCVYVSLLGYKRKTLIMMMLMNKKTKIFFCCSIANNLVQISICSIVSGHIHKTDIFIGIFVTHTHKFTHSPAYSLQLFLFARFSTVLPPRCEYTCARTAHCSMCYEIDMCTVHYSYTRKCSCR